MFLGKITSDYYVITYALMESNISQPGSKDDMRFIIRWTNWLTLATRLSKNMELGKSLRAIVESLDDLDARLTKSVLDVANRIILKIDRVKLVG